MRKLTSRVTLAATLERRSALVLDSVEHALAKFDTSTDTQFAKLEESIGYMVRNAHRVYDRVLGEHLARHDVLSGQYSLLRVLWHEDNLSQIQVAKRMKVERASLTLMLNTVERAGLITRNVDVNDRRKQLISLSPKGRALERVLIPLGTKVNGIALAGLSDRETATLRGLLARVISNLESEGG